MTSNRKWPAINHDHRYLVMMNGTRRFVSSTNDLDAPIPDGYALIDTKGEDGTGPGVRNYLGGGKRK